jgi:hypothetical protein
MARSETTRFRLDSKVAVITGGDPGLGAAIAPLPEEPQD